MDEILAPIKARILEYIEYEKLTKEEFYAFANISASNFKGKGKNSELGGDKIAKILSLYPDLNAEWLLTGKGDMLNEQRDKTETSGQIRAYPLRADRLIDIQQIPIYDMDAVAGLMPLFTDNFSQQVVEVMETNLIPKCDGGLRIVGDSMYPLLKSGDIVFYKKINDIKNSIIWGEMYLVSFSVDDEEYVAVKYIHKSELPDHILLVSQNEHHKSQDIHIGRIRALAFIKASLRINSFK